MKKIVIRTSLAILVGAVLFFAPTALADSTASMLLTDAGNNGALGDVYIGPYTATIDGVSTSVICDDYDDESYIGETWTANVTTLSSLGGTKWVDLGNSTNLYEEAAWLSINLLSAGQGQAGDIQFAIWTLFDANALNALSGADQANVWCWIDAAEAQTFSPGEFANVLIYTADMTDPIRCDGNYCANTPPQEFIVVTPEPSQLILMLTGLLVVAVAVRRKKSAATGANPSVA
jgi:hypothetical protein